MQVKGRDGPALDGRIGLDRKDGKGRDQHGDDEIRRADEHERPQVALQFECGPMDDWDIDAPGQRGPDNEQQHEKPPDHQFELLWDREQQFGSVREGLGLPLQLHFDWTARRRSPSIGKKLGLTQYREPVQ